MRPFQLFDGDFLRNAGCTGLGGIATTLMPSSVAAG
jgi:hypothetical protein